MDCHHHFYDTRKNGFSGFLSRFLPEESFLPADYARDVLAPIRESETLSRRGLRHAGSVHVECMPDDGLSEVEWVESLRTGDDGDEPRTTVSAIVASCHLAGDDPAVVRRKLERLAEVSPRVRGIRWILDCAGPRMDGTRVTNPATHPGNLRHDGIDYLEPGTRHAGAFEEGFAVLADLGLSFDLQCAPRQLANAADLCSRHPGVPVVIDHLGKPMQLLGPNNSEMVPDEAKLDEWRKGMAAMAALPQAHVKISGLGWAVPNWTASARRIDLVKKLCQETVELFGPERCMVATNWHKDAVASDSDGLGDSGPSPDEYLETLLGWFGGLTPDEQRRLFAGTARDFYRIEE